MSEALFPGNAHRPIVAITQARMGSTRLPGKVMMPVFGKPLLWWHLTRLQRVRGLDAIIVATTEEPAARLIVDVAASLGIGVFRGPLDDVLARFDGAAADAATILRVTSDCPLIDPALIDGLIDAYLQRQPEIDYMSINVSRIPRGLDAEIFRRDLLKIAMLEASDPAEREHVTPFIYRRPERFRLASYDSSAPSFAGRLCVDTAEDLALVTRIIEALAPETPNFSLADIAAYLAAHPEALSLNAHVAQKHL